MFDGLCISDHFESGDSEISEARVRWIKEKGALTNEQSGDDAKAKAIYKEVIPVMIDLVGKLQEQDPQLSNEHLATLGTCTHRTNSERLRPCICMSDA